VTGTAPAGPTEARRGAVWTGAIVLVAATLLAYLPVLAGGGFIWDDDDYLTRNRVLEADDALARIWTTHQTPQYYPVVFTSFLIERSLWGLDPLGYHFVNVLLHAANALLAWLLARRLGIPCAWLVGALFALHPVHVESVAWITERKNVLSGLFYLLAALAYLRFETGPEQQRTTAARAAWYATALVLFALALLSKSVTCSLPAALILALLLLRRRLTVRRLLPLAPMFLMGLAAAIHTATLERGKVGAYGPDFDWSLVERVLIASRALLFYPWKLAVPAPLMFIYPRWPIDATAVVQYVPVLVVLLLAAGGVLLYRRGRRGPVLAVAFYAGTILPALGFFNVYPHLFSFVADHFVYLASLGLLALLAAGFATVVRCPKRRVLFALVPLAALAMLTFIRASTYVVPMDDRIALAALPPEVPTDDPVRVQLLHNAAETVWRDTIERNPEAWMARNNLASSLLRRTGDAIRQSQPPDPEALEEARTHAQRAIELRPQHHTAHANLSEALRLQGRLEEALEHVTIARDLRPHLWDYHYQVGRLAQQLGRPDEAIPAYEEALQRVRPGGGNELTVRLELGRLLYQLDRRDEAAVHLGRAAEIDQKDFLSNSLLGEMALADGDDRLARQRFIMAMAGATNLPDQLKIGYRLALLMATSRDETVRNGADALEMSQLWVERTGRRSPHMLEALAAAHAELGQLDLAIAVAEEALAMARAQNAGELAADLERELQAYRAGAPFRR
jgi:tetratricopeptide (TPR) repeat protein